MVSSRLISRAQLIPAIVNTLLVPPALALAVSIATVAVLMGTRAATFALDRPNQRSLHVTPTPRLGGIGIIAGAVAGWLYSGFAVGAGVVVALLVLIGISLADDVYGVAVHWRFIAYLTGAAIGVAAILTAGEAWQIVLAVLATAWMINLYNFMDGSDGRAGGMATIGFGTYGIGALVAGDFSFAAVNLSIAAAALGFLLFNFPPARIFMGDAGAIPLGFLAAIMNIAGAQRGDWPVWLGVVVFSPFIVDASVTLVARARRRARVWQAHKEHYYQRLVQNGWGHRRTALAEYALMTACAAAALAGMQLGSAAQAALLAGVGLAYAALVYALERNLPTVVPT